MESQITELKTKKTTHDCMSHNFESERSQIIQDMGK
jgi:hypothetical protein